MDILCPLPGTTSKIRFMLEISCRFSKLKEVMTLRDITDYRVAVALCNHWSSEYGPHETILTEDGKQFPGRFLQAFRRHPKVRNKPTTT